MELFNYFYLQKNWTSKLTLIAFLLISFSTYCSTPFSPPSLSSNSTGIIGDVVEYNGSLYIGSENGLFRITGELIEKLGVGTDYFESGFIFDLAIKNNQLWIAVFGKGLFRMDFSTGLFEQVPVDPTYQEYLWAVHLERNYFIVSYGSGFTMYPHDSRLLPQRFDVETIADDKNAELIGVAKMGTHIVAIINMGLIYIDIADWSFKYIPLTKQLANLPTIEAFYFNQNELWIGGRKGVYELDQNLNAISFYSFESQVHNKLEAILPNGEDLWVAAGGVYSLNQKNILSEGQYLQPYLKSSRIKAVTKLLQLPNGEILVISAQQGMIKIPENYKSINYLNVNDGILHNSFYSTIQLTRQYSMLAGDAGYYLMNNESGVLTLAYKATMSDAALLKFGNQITDVKNCKTFLYQMDSKLVQLDEAPNSKLCDKNAFVTHVNNKQILLSSENGNKKLLVLDLNGNSLLESIAPSNVYLATLDDEGTVYAATHQNHVLSYKSGVWATELNESFVNLHYNCMTVSRGFIFLCTQGSGLIAFDLVERHSKKIEFSNLARFIRDMVVVPHGFLISTNQGLNFLSADMERTKFLGKKMGIFDTDFENSGIHPIGREKILINGDDHTYLISTDTTWSVKDPPDSLKLVSLSDENFTIHEPDWSSKQYSIEPNTKNYKALVANQDVLMGTNNGLEYRFDPSQPWLKVLASYGYIELSHLSYGEHLLEVRVAGTDVNGTHLSLKIKKVPPFYLSNVAFGGYLILAIIFSFWLVWYVRYSAEQRKLRHLNEMAEKRAALEESDTSLGRVLREKHQAILKISQEIKNPLMLVTEPLKDAASYTTDPDLLTLLSGIQSSAGKVHKLVEQLLEIERLSVVREIPLCEYDVAYEADSCIGSVAPLAEAKDQVIISKLDADGKIVVIQDTIQRIFMNLLVNAIKYSPNGSKIFVQTKWKFGQLYILVKDQGPGMSKNQIEYVFDRFARLNDNLNDDGIGPGLSLLRELIRANSGMIQIQSEDKKGSKFVINLPNQKTFSKLNDSVIDFADKKDFTGESTENDAEVNDDFDKSKDSILIAEGDGKLRAYLKTLFADRYSCLVAHDGSQALELAKRFKPRVIIIDDLISGMSGIELTRHVRADKEIENSIVIVLSASKNSETVKLAYETEVDDFMVKPIDRDTIQQKVRNYLKFRNRLVKTNTEIKGEALENISPIALSRVRVVLSSKDQLFYVRLCDCMERLYSDHDFSRSICASEMFVSERQLNRKLEKLFNISFVELLKQYRLHVSKSLLIEGVLVTDVAFECGFASTSYFSTVFRKAEGITPKTFAKKYSVT